jgi:hypothetical protein
MDMLNRGTVVVCISEFDNGHVVEPLVFEGVLFSCAVDRCNGLKMSIPLSKFGTEQNVDAAKMATISICEI